MRAGLMMLALAVAIAPAAASAAPKKYCVVPALEFEDGDAVLGRHFAPLSKPLATLQANVRAGFQRACNKGLIAGSNVPQLDKAALQRLWIANIPDGNVATLSSDQLPGGTGWRLMLEHPFVASDGKISVPSVGDIEEAIFCAVRGATPTEQEESGRCLVD